MDKSEYHKAVVTRSRSENGMVGTRHYTGDYELPYPMKHMLEVEEWVGFFRPQPLYGEIADNLSDNYIVVEADVFTTKDIISILSDNYIVVEGKSVACETCHEVNNCGFDYETYFNREEYSRILSKSRACSLDCAIKYVCRGDYAPSVSEFKNNPEQYKTLGSVR